MFKENVFNSYGVVFSISIEKKTYYVIIPLIFDVEKVYGNDNIELDTVTIFNEKWERVPKDDDIIPLIDHFIINQIINES